MSFNPETVNLLRDALDDAWVCLRLEHQAAMQKTALAERMLNPQDRVNVIATACVMPC